MDIPDGWQLVPKEPTPEMLRASKFSISGAKTVEACDRAIYTAMLGAAPSFPESAPPMAAPQLRAERDPSVMSDWCGADTSNDDPQ